MLENLVPQSSLDPNFLASPSPVDHSFTSNVHSNIRPHDSSLIDTTSGSPGIGTMTEGEQDQDASTPESPQTPRSSPSSSLISTSTPQSMELPDSGENRRLRMLLS